MLLLPPAPSESEALHMFVVYERPRDFPEHYVARRHDVRFGASAPTTWVRFAPTLEAVRRMLPRGLVRLARHEADDPCIVETWV